MSDALAKTYAGYTIGPIYDVMRHARKTRELWFASYFFSWFMEKLIEEILARGRQGVKVLMPWYETKPDGTFVSNASRSGKYTDRLVIASNSDSAALEKVISDANQEVLNYFAGVMDELVDKEKARGGKRTPNHTSDILEGYLQTRFFAAAAEDLPDCVINPVAAVEQHLNALEEAFVFKPGISDPTCERCKTLPAVVVTRVEEKPQFPLCPLCLAKFRSNRIGALLGKLSTGVPPEQLRLRYPTVQEIGAADIFHESGNRDLIDMLREIKRDEGGDDSDLSFQDLSRELGCKIPTFYKYMAVVKADGDNVGRLIAAGTSSSDLSRRLFEFSSACEALVADHGGALVLVGGDDLLAFMPVFFRGKSILDFVSALAERYSKVVDRGQAQSTLSIGMNIAYYRYPLWRAIERADDLLFGHAKNQKSSLAMALTRHSGSEEQVELRIKSAEFEALTELLCKLLATKAAADSVSVPDGLKLPRGIFYNLARFKRLIASLPDRDRVRAFFDNNFNEAIHQKQFKNGLDAVCGLICKYLFDLAGGTADERLTTVFSLLKIIRFLTMEE